MAYPSDQPRGPKEPEEKPVPDAEGHPGAPEPSPVPEPPSGTGPEMRTIQTLTTIAMIAGPVSMIVGGVPLSLVALACAIVAWRKARRAVLDAESADRELTRALERQAVVSIAMAAVATTFNVVSLALIMPALIEALQDGNVAALFGNGAGLGGSEGSAGGLGGPSSDSAWG